MVAKGIFFNLTIIRIKEFHHKLEMDIPDIDEIQYIC